MGIWFSFFENSLNTTIKKTSKKMINTLFIGKNRYNFDLLPSTNQYAMELLAKSSPSEGTLILTHNQYAGKGQMNNKWESEAGKNLTFTIILYPKFLAARHQFLLNQTLCLSIYKALNKYISNGVKIKWPNDIYVHNKKITGILIQNSLKGYYLQSSIIGIGLNVNQKEFISDAPNPTSMALETGVEYNLEEVLATICHFFENYYLQLKANNIASIQEAYLENLFRFKEIHFFKRADGTLFKGKIIGITEIGKLIIKTEQGQEETFAFKEVKHII
jgi:BirA family biotin operon repressor/biotin-[acetyl-CoA-carboxylase] ligase